MNNFFNFQIPYISSQFGVDWGSFTTIVDDNTDYIMNKTFELYRLKDPARMPAPALEIALKLRDIETTPAELLSVKREKLRSFSTGYRNKGTADLYLDYAEAITGGRGEIFQGYDSGYTDWGVSSWSMGLSEANARVWETPAVVYKIYVEPKIEGLDEHPKMYLPLEMDALDDSGNAHDGTATDIIYSDTPDQRLYLPLETDALDDSDFAVATTPTDIIYSDTPDMRMYLPLTADALDDSDFGNNGTDTDVVYTVNGAVFNGTTSKIEIPNLNFNSDWTLALNINRTGASESNIGAFLFAGTWGGGSAIQIFDGNDGVLQFRFINPSNVEVVLYCTVDSTDHKYAIIKSGDLFSVYQNNISIGTPVSIANHNLGSCLLKIGEGFTHVTGVVANVFLFDKALSDVERTQLYTYNTFPALSKKVACFYKSASNVLLTPTTDMSTLKSISLRFKRNGLSSVGDALYTKFLDSNNFLDISLISTGQLFVETKISGVWIGISYKTTNLCDGVEHFIVVDFISYTSVQITVDDSSDTVKTIGDISGLGAGVEYLGCLNIGAYVLNGYISDFYIFNRNLTIAEATNLYLYNIFAALSKKVACFYKSASNVLLTPTTDMSTLKSISLRFKRNGLSSVGDVLYTKFIDSNNYLAISLISTGQLFVETKISGTPTFAQYKTTNLCDGIEHFIVVNFLSYTSVQISVDNSPDTVQTIGDISGLGAGVEYLGCLTAGGFVLNGYISDFYIFNRNLTTAEATWIYEHNLDDEFYSKLDDIVDIYRQDFIRPAFYDMYIVNSNFKILRTV